MISPFFKKTVGTSVETVGESFTLLNLGYAIAATFTHDI